MPRPPLTPPAESGSLDMAEGRHAEQWLRHPVLGDPSFDAFEHATGNPIYRGRPPREWSVNGFLFEDPQGGGLFAYVGRYPHGYACGPGVVRSDCVVLRSRDDGKTWEEIGPVFAGDFTFAGDAVGANNTPDISVVFADGRYHMAYDWGQDTATWASAFNPKGNDDGGIGYAWSDRPEGPFHRHPVPVFRNSMHHSPVPGKYLRLYASTLLQRAQDWLLLTLTDSGPHFAWGLYAITAQKPEGPWSAPSLVQSLEGDAFHPALMEFFPAFAHAGQVYGPATSVAMNRNFQCLWRAPLEQAHDPAAWVLHQHGSLWHAADREDEHHGIWGQTFSGQVGRDGRLRVLFPGRDRQGNGTIGLAARPWTKPLRERGFVLNGCVGSGLTLLRRAHGKFHLRCRATVRGTARLLWGWNGVLGPDRHGSDATLHPLARTNYRAWEWRADGWSLIDVDATGVERLVASGRWTRTVVAREVELDVAAAGRVRLVCEGAEVWEGDLAMVTGMVGWLVEPGTHLAVEVFEISGRSERAIIRWHLLDAFLATGVNAEGWEIRDDAGSPGGQVAVCKNAGGRIKWNFTGTGVRWYAPRGPGQGRVRVKIDGTIHDEIDLQADAPIPAGVVYACDDLSDGRHALVLEAISGRLATGGLDAIGA